MNTTNPVSETQAAVATPIFDPFPTPRTYPSGWDLSELPASLAADSHQPPTTHD